MRAQKTAGMGAVIMTNSDNGDSFCTALMGFIGYRSAAFFFCI
jgi:hypothetical protein